jgi:class 3 adenylate cyclase
LWFAMVFSISAKASTIGYADSLYHELLKSPGDTLLIRNLNDACNRFAFNQPDTALFYISKALEYSESLNYQFGIVNSLNMLGYAYEMKADFDTARIFYSKAAKLAEQHHFTRILTNIYNNLSILESTIGNYEKSLEHLLDALGLAEQQNDSNLIGMITGNIGLRYSELQSQEIAIEYLRRAIEINTLTGRTGRLKNNFGNLGRSYYILQNHDSSEVNYRKAVHIAQQQSDEYNLWIYYQGLALVFVAKERFDSAMVYQKLGYNAAIANNDEYGIAQALLILGNIQVQKKDYAGAEKNIREAIAISKRLKLKPLLIDGYKTLSDLYELKKEFEKALEYSELFTALLDTFYRQERDKALGQIKKFEDEKTEREKQLLENEIELEKLEASRQRVQRNLFIVAGGLLFLLAAGLFHRFLYVRRTKNQLAEQNVIIKEEKERSEELLLNILPSETAQELKLNGSAKSRHYDFVTVLFTDFVGFTQMAEKLTPSELVDEINHYFSEFDKITTKYNLEKIKTIGDAYMCAGGLPVPNKTNAIDAVQAAKEIIAFVDQLAQTQSERNLPAFQVRIGIHTGPVVAGIVGIKKFAYDIWGDTVNIASRLESSGEPGVINISQNTMERVKHRFTCTHRGKISVKGKGEIDMYFVE